MLLIFDEAHLLDGDALTDLRLLISSAVDVGPPLKILLAGQDPLRAVLRRSRHADLLNRISVRYQIRPLTREQTLHYIDFQLTQAGGDPKLLDDLVIRVRLRPYRPLSPLTRGGQSKREFSGQII
ncbi:MAG: hypothetical protein GXX96_05040 [Planctomycetaceae bacterium]|nr:hypothetical protein [Planctomycetaceae bacterium]